MKRSDEKKSLPQRRKERKEVGAGFKPALTLILSVFVFWFFYFDPETNFTTRLGPFVTRTQCAAFRDDLKAAASPALYFSACWVSD